MPKAKNLTYLRKKAGLTQETLAAATGFAKSTINAWETKKRSIPKSRSMEIAKFFGVDYSAFCDVDLELEELEHLELTDSERQNFKKYRQLPENIKELIRLAVTVEYDNMKGDAQ